MKSKSNQESLTLTGRINRMTHTVSDLQSKYPNWDEFSKQEKLEAVHNTEPENEDVVYNVTTDRLHEYFVDNLDPANASVEANVTSEYMALGVDGASGTATSDTDLNQREYYEPVTDHADNGKELLASTFVDSTEGNNNTFDEIGLYTGDPADLDQEEVFLINHATFSGVEKDNSKTITFDVTLTFSDV